MQSERITALSTAVIAFATVIGLMFGFYYNLKISNVNTSIIILLELLFLTSMMLFIMTIRRKIKHE